jgi:cyclophilin family peptidyl-prolyl cis-trans isomerase
VRGLAGVLVALCALLGLAACGGDEEPAAAPAGCTDARPPAADPKTYGAPPPTVIDPSRSLRARIATSCGDIVVQLDAAAAPIAVNNFVFLAREGFYDGLTFHRAVRGGIIQGGDPRGDGTGGPGYVFPDELPDDGYPTGSVAMANAGPNTNGSQFFIVTGRAPLPNAFTRFGRVVEGLDAAQRIEGFADPDADPGDPAAQRPTRDVFIFRVTIEEGGG